MYRLTFDDWPLYDPRGANKIDRLIVREPDVQIGVNKAGSISFVLDPGHPHADKITKLHGTLELTDDAGVLFRGRVLDDRQNFDKSMRYTAEGALAWLNDGIVEPYDFPADFQGDPAYQAAAASGNVVSFYLGWLLDGYNAHAAPERQIKLGNVTVTDPNNYITRADSSYPSTFEVISKKLAGSSLGGYMVMRYEADGNYLDYLSGFVGNNVQEITFGENLLDLVRESTAADLYTAVLPIGSDGLTLSGLPDGPQENGLVKAGKILYDPEAEATYGRIVRKAEYTDITQAENLLRTAIKDLAAEIRLPESLQVKACDLHYLDGKTPSFRLGLYTVVVSAPHGIVRKSYPLTELRPNLLDPGSTPITLNGTASQLTARLRQAQQSEQEQREREIQTVVKEASAWIDEIVKNASGLYCTPEVQPDGSTIYYLHDKPTLKESVNVIKLTSDAIGFSTDGGNTYPYGFSVTGEMIANILYANGVNAGWVRTGILQSADGKTFFLDLDKGVLRLEATELTISGKSVNEALADAITGVEQQFYLSDSPTALAGGEWSNTQPEWAQGKYIWSRQYVTYGNGSHAYLPSESGVCVTGNNGKDGTDGKDGDPGVNGTNGVGVESVEAEYCVTKSVSSASGGNWSTTMPAVKDGEYIWTRQKVTYSNGDIEYTEAYCMSKTMGDIAQHAVDAQTQTDIFNKLTNNGALEGLFMRDGKLYINASYLVSGILKSLDGTTFFLDLVNGILKMNATELTIAGKSVNEAMSDAITAAVQQFYLSDSPAALAGGEWSTTQPEWTQGKYIWSRQYVTYGDGTSEYTPSENGVCITGNTGQDGADGTNGTSTYTHIRYSANADGTGFVADPTASTKYIGIYTGTSQTAPANKEAYIWSKYMGDNGTNGKDGNGIRSISYFYAATPNQTPPAASDITGTAIPALSEANKYLWQKEVIDFTDASVADKTTVILLAVYGDKGKDGTNGTNGTSVSITSTSITYQASDSGTTTPTGNWSASVPPVENGQYLWTKTIVTYSDGASTTAYSVAYKGTNGVDGASARVIITTNGGTTAQLEEWSSPGHRGGLYPQDSAVMDILKIGDQVSLRLRNNDTNTYAYILGTVYRLSRATDPDVTRDTIWYEAAGMISSGADGIGIESVTAEYIQSPSATSPDEDPMAQWSADIPEVLPGRYIWTRQKIVYSTGAVEYAGLYCMTKTMGDIAQQKVDAQTQMDIFNKLTNNGALQGVFMRDGQLYINAQYLRGDTIDLSLLRLVGTLCGLMQGYGATASGHTTQGIVIYGNGVDTSGNANPPYILVSNEGIRLKDTVGTDFNISYGEAEVNGAFRVRPAAGKTGGVNADGVIHSATQLYSDGDAVAVGNMYAADFQRTSDRRMKKDIEPLADIYARALDNMTPVRYRYKTDPDTGPYRLGYIAQDVTAALEAAGVPDTGIVREWEDNDGNAHLAMSYDNLIALLHLKINGLEAEIKQLKEGITSGT